MTNKRKQSAGSSRASGGCSRAKGRSRNTVKRQGNHGTPGGIREPAKLGRNPRPSGSKCHGRARSNAYLRLLPCKRLQRAALGCNRDGPRPENCHMLWIARTVPPRWGEAPRQAESAADLIKLEERIEAPRSLCRLPSV